LVAANGRAMVFVSFVAKISFFFCMPEKFN
jgi:hypothetical protein